MTAPRPLSNGTRVGYGLIAGIITVYGLIATAVIAIVAALLKSWRDSA